jgi:hypothetical protein
VFRLRSIAVVLASAIAATCLPTGGDAATYGHGTYLLNVSDRFGAGPFGSVTVSDLGGGTAEIEVDVAPNFLLDTGSHFTMTLSLAGSASIDANSFSSSYFHLASGDSFKNAPFQSFTSAISADCTKGNCGPTLGSSLTFEVVNFAGLTPATQWYDDQPILFAVDVSCTVCELFQSSGLRFASGREASVTGVVGAVAMSPVPLPGALGLFGSALVGLALLRRRRAAAYAATRSK